MIVPPPNRWRRRALALLTALFVALGVVVGGPALSASAHNQVTATNPVIGSTISTAPAKFSITTNLPLLVVDGSTSGFALQVIGPNKRYYESGCITVVNTAMFERVSLGEAGAYTIRWQLVSADGHTVSGEYPFTWAPAAGTPAAKGTESPLKCGEAAASATASPGAKNAAPVIHSAVPLGDVLWIGGAVLAILIAAGATLIVMTRRRPTGGTRKT